jgi:hypothetical protein
MHGGFECISLLFKEEIMFKRSLNKIKPQIPKGKMK